MIQIRKEENQKKQKEKKLKVYKVKYPQKKSVNCPVGAAGGEHSYLPSIRISRR